MNEATIVSGPETPTQSGFGTGWRVVARKEFADHLRSARFMVLAGVFGIVAVACVFAASGGIRSVATQAMGVPAIFLRLLTLQNDPVPYPLITLFMGFLGPLLGIAFGFDAISSERSQGTLPRLLAQPIHRDEVIIGKFVAGLSIVGVMLFAMVSFIAGIGMFRLGITPTTAEISRLLVWVIIAILYVGFWQAMAIALSTRTGAATAILVALAVWLVLVFFGAYIFGAVGGILGPGDDVFADERATIMVSRLSPVTLFSETSILLLDPTQRTVDQFTTQQADRAIVSNLTLSQSLSVVWPQVVGLLAMTGVLFALAFVSFMRQEIRA